MEGECPREVVEGRLRGRSDTMAMWCANESSDTRVLGISNQATLLKNQTGISDQAKLLKNQTEIVQVVWKPIN
jgi:hypothetical protein